MGASHRLYRSASIGLLRFSLYARASAARNKKRLSRRLAGATHVDPMKASRFDKLEPACELLLHRRAADRDILVTSLRRAAAIERRS
jgi:hypothetical protein